MPNKLPHGEGGNVDDVLGDFSVQSDFQPAESATFTAPQVLILGGCGRIGASVALDMLRYTQAELCLASRNPQFPELLAAFPNRIKLLTLDLSDAEAVEQAIASSASSDTEALADGYDLVIHCAGPFRQRDLAVLRTCIAAGVNYLDVSDSPDYVREALELKEEAIATNITAIVSTGVFPGLSNSMARLAAEQFERLDDLQLNYVVAGSGGAGKTVMRTTFLELQTPFPAWIDGQWQEVLPYSDREQVEFLPPYGKSSVYWFSTSEAATLPKSFACNNVVTKFGSLPHLYNVLTGAMTWKPLEKWLQNPVVVEELATVSYAMTQVSDRFSGVGLAMQVVATGIPKVGNLPNALAEADSRACFQIDFCHENTAIAAGQGTGMVAADLLMGRLQKPGVWPVEQAVPTSLFLEALAPRSLEIAQQWRS